LSFIEASPLHELLSVAADVLINLILLAIVFWMFRSGRLGQIWNQITSLSIFGVSIEKETAQEAENLSISGDKAESLAASAAQSVVIWATSGRRPGKTIDYLRGQGFVLQELDPIGQRDAISSALLKSEKPIVVTNLLHGTSHQGGQDFAKFIRSGTEGAKIVLFTSEAARIRRSAHIKDEVAPDLIATNGPDMAKVLRELVLS